MKNIKKILSFMSLLLVTLLLTACNFEIPFIKSGINLPFFNKEKDNVSTYTNDDGIEFTNYSGYYLDSEYYYVLDETNSITLETEYYGTEENKDKYTTKFSQTEFTTQGIYKVTCDVYKGDKVLDSLRTIVTVDNKPSTEFDEYVQEMFVYFLEGDQLTLNIFFEDYEAYGFEHGDAEWYKYEAYSDEDYASDLEEIQRLRTEFNSYSDAKLSYDQLVTKSVIDQNIKYYETFLADKNNVLMNMSYVDQFGGYCADFPTYIEAYELRTKEDVEDFISYLETSYDGFLSYGDYIRDRQNAGFALSIDTLDLFVEYLDGVMEKGDKYYLYNVVNQKIKGAQLKGVITSEETSTYSSEAKNAVDKLLLAHSDLKKKIESYVKLSKNIGNYDNYKAGYLQNYKGGKELYESILRNKLGMYDLTIDEYSSYLDKSLSKYMKLYRSAATSLNSDSEANKISNGQVAVIDSNDPQDIIDYLKEFAKTIAPELETEPNIEFVDMDETTTANTTTLAYYMKSALDSTDSENIHLNRNKLGDDKVETISTIAHEGYPGHLYEYVYTKENEHISNLVKVNTCTGHGEGWAKYVEYALAKYIAEQKNSESWDIAMKSNYYWSLYSYCLYAKIDVLINYYGYDVTKVQSFMKSQGLNSEAATDIFNMLIEIPGQYAPYGYGFSVFYELHEKAQTELGEYYNEVKFNEAIIEHGWISLDETQRFANQFIDEQKFLFGLE